MAAEICLQLQRKAPCLARDVKSRRQRPPDSARPFQSDVRSLRIYICTSSHISNRKLLKPGQENGRPLPSRNLRFTSMRRRGRSTMMTTATGLLRRARRVREGVCLCFVTRPSKTGAISLKTSVWLRRKSRRETFDFAIFSVCVRCLVLQQ